MSSLMIILTVVSFIGLIVISIFNYFKSKNIRNLILHLLLMVIGFGLIYWFFFPHDTFIPKGDENHDYLIIASYIFLVLGMLAHYLYYRLSQPSRKKKKFNLGYFLAPVLISPIVFIPLLATFQNADFQLDTMSAKLMFFFVAFENGFFWKEFFDNRLREKGGSPNAKEGLSA